MIEIFFPHLKNNMVNSSFFSYLSKLLKEIQILFFSLTDFSGKKIIFLLSSIITGDLDEIFINLFVVLTLSFKVLPKNLHELSIICLLHSSMTNSFSVVTTLVDLSSNPINSNVDKSISYIFAPLNLLLKHILLSKSVKICRKKT